MAGGHNFDLAPGTMFSLIGFSDLSRLSITGVKWPLENIDVPFGSSLTLSNVVTGELSVNLGAGQALLIAQVTD